MKRVLIAALAAALIQVPMLRADDKPAEKSASRTDQVNAIKNDYMKAQQDWFNSYRNAKTEDDKKEVLKKRPTATEYVKRAQKMVADNAKDDAAFDALSFIAQQGGADGSQAFKTLAENFASNPKIWQDCLMAGQRNETKFLETVLEKNSDKKAKGMACYALGNSYHSQAGESAEKAASLDQKAEQYLARVEKEFADVELRPAFNKNPAMTLGNMAKRVLFEIRNLGIGKTSPEVVSHNLDDKEVKLSDYRGKILILDFWATWCGPCRQMIPHSRQLVEKMKDKPVALVSVSCDAEKETLTKFIEKEPMPWTHWWEGVKSDSVLNVWNIQGIPTVYVIDPKGVIRYKQVGFNPEKPDALDKEIEKLLEEGSKK
jgi:thiol-disulfide isomerase/thioredoxin